MWLAKKAGVTVRTAPHGLRHSAITTALDETNDPRAVRSFSRHAKWETLMLYDDKRRDLGGKVAEQLAALVKPRR